MKKEKIKKRSVIGNRNKCINEQICIRKENEKEMEYERKHKREKTIQHRGLTKRK